MSHGLSLCKSPQTPNEPNYFYACFRQKYLSLDLSIPLAVLLLAISTIKSHGSYPSLLSAIVQRYRSRLTIANQGYLLEIQKTLAEEFLRFAIAQVHPRQRFENARDQ
jgi:hypothetical protein